MAHIRLENVTKTFGAHKALEGLDLEIADGEFFVLLGPTGAGKTTTLRLIAGLEKPTSGSISIDHEDVLGWTAAQRDVALVFQHYSLYPRYTVRQNLEFPLRSRVRRYAQDDIDKRVARAAKTLRIEHLLDRKTDRLSGGEMQRVSIGRAIVREPRVFLMDEPLSNLDAKLREALRSELKDLQMKLGATFLFVTHDQIEAMSMGDKVGVLNQGRIIQIAKPQEIYSRPRDLFVAGFVGSPAMNLVPGEVRDGRLSALSGQLMFPAADVGGDGLQRHSGAVTVGIRSEDIRIGPGEAAEARVHDVENLGVEKIVTLRAGDHLLRATAPAVLDLPIDSPVRFGWNPRKLHVFNPTTGANFAFG
ncbi:MAG TPA: ABC transporter ATP-binding protein [Dongiaceae bacterium]|jgi:multiple sugar transport system ATP-binding protein